MERTRIHTKHPFSNYQAYRVFNKRKGRWMVNLTDLTSGRCTSMTYARYVMSVALGRILTSDEEVDHANNNKTDDSFDNLQILTQKQNFAKFLLSTGRLKRMINLQCPVCGVTFSRRAKQVEWKLRVGRTPACSKQCGGLVAYGKQQPRRALSGQFAAS